jgi:hypothetical protein
MLQVSCRGEVNECQNGGTMIWDPVKPFNCVCKKGYEGAICKNGINIIIFFNMKVHIFDLKAYIYSHITTKSSFIRNQVFLTNQ